MLRCCASISGRVVWPIVAVALAVGCAKQQSASPPPAATAASGPATEATRPAGAPNKPAGVATPAAKAEKASPFKFERPVRSEGKNGDDSVPCPRFEDASAARGLDHVYRNGEAGGSLMVEAIGGGVGWLDYDRDGLWDLYFNQGGDPAVADRSNQPFDRIFRRLPPSAGGRYIDVTAACRIHETGYGQGVAVGDFDDDGFDDVYVTNVGANTLYRNLGDGTFVDVTAAAGVGDDRWSSSAAWADLDGDGDLDLYVCNYVRYDPFHPMDCRNVKGEPRICHPRDVEHWPDECYENLGDGSFRPVAEAWGLFGPGNKALGVAVADFTNDGLPDIYVANDTTPNFLFVNEGKGADGEMRFRESATLLGCALYRNLGASGFEDVTGLVGLHEPTLPRLGFGTAMADFNADGRQELIIANGHVENYPGSPLLKMKAQLFSFNGQRFKDCSSAAGPYFEEKLVGRGVALADFDGDGDLDVAIAHQNSPAALLENRSAAGHWLTFQCIGARSNRRGIGARVTVTSGDRTWIRELGGGSSYASTHQPLLSVGLGDRGGPCTVEIRWPSGATQRLEGTAVDQAIVLREPAVNR